MSGFAKKNRYEKTDMNCRSPRAERVAASGGVFQNNDRTVEGSTACVGRTLLRGFL